MLLRERKDPQTAYNQHILETTGKTHTIGTFFQESDLMKQIHQIQIFKLLILATIHKNIARLQPLRTSHSP